jgi:hypothetical protein
LTTTVNRSFTAFIQDATLKQESNAALGIGSGKVTLMLDPDDAGRRCRDDVLNRLIRKVSVRVVDLDAPPDELSERALRAALHL